MGMSEATHFRWCRCCTRFLRQFSQYGVYQWSGRALARLLDQFHRFMDGGVRGNAVEKIELINRPGGARSGLRCRVS